MKKISCVIIDIMGTIIIPPSLESFKIFLSINNNSSIFPNSFAKKLFEIGYPLALVNYTDEKDFMLKQNYFLTTDLSLKEILKDGRNLSFTRKYINFFVENCQIRRDFYPLINHLRNNSKKIILLSNMYSCYKDIVSKFKLNDWCDQVLLSCDIGIKKPNKELLSVISNHPKKCAYIGDSYLSDIKPAQELGMTLLYFCTEKTFIYLKNNGINDFIINQSNNGVFINFLLYKYLLKKQLFDVNNCFISNKYICKTNNTLFLKCLCDLNVVNSFTECIKIL